MLASLLWGAYLSDWDLPPIFKPENTKELLGLLAATAVAIVPLGYLISTISVAVLRSLAMIAKTPTYEAVLSDTTFDRVWRQIKIQDTLAQDKELSIVGRMPSQNGLLSKAHRNDSNDLPILDL